MTKQMTWHEAIQAVLAEAPWPMHPEEIADLIIARKWRTDVGATPAATVSAQLASSIKHKGTDSPYIRISKGIYALATSASTVAQPADAPPQPPKLTSTVFESPDVEEQYEIITSFGMFWRRSSVEWASKMKLLGKQQLGATPVDFCGQLGIYLLYDGREVIYIGRTTDRPLGRRLYEHTLDRMGARWDRFSWFGLLPVSEQGELGQLPTTFEAAKLIPALEAILIEALEPRQNRKRGDDLSAVEFIQHEDPQIQRKKLKNSLEEALGRL